MDPAKRLKDLVAKANDFDVDWKIPATKYLRSSREMERMVNSVDLKFYSVAVLVASLLLTVNFL